ncbi:MAG: formate dehydrogenase accessory sulfurtransferase FdhD [Pseudomonadota bacterium]
MSRQHDEELNVTAGEPAVGAGSQPLALIGAASPEKASATVEVERWTHGTTTRTTDRVADEVPVALVYHGVPHVVMLATPADLEDYAVGFTLSEGLVARPEEIRSVEVAHGGDSIEVRIAIAWERYTELLQRRRNLTGRTGCGVCGAETVEQAVRPLAPVREGPKVSTTELHDALERLRELQPLNAVTGSVHAAAWLVPGKGIRCVREDVGRHNALDKTIGALVRAGEDLSAGCMLVTSRASFEMVQKSAAVGITFLAAVSAPTALAIRVARETGVTLVGFARREQHVVYARPDRLV